MTTFWINSSNELIKATSDPNAQPAGAVTSTEIPPDDGRLQIWNGTAWVDIANREDVVADAEINSGFVNSRTSRLMFEIEFDQENRIRVLEGLPSITKAQYKNALKMLLKTL